MSDFSGLEQSFALAGMPPVSQFDDLAAYAPPSTDVQPHEVSFKRLMGPQQIATVLHLRNEIALPASALSDAGFGTREKKETR